MFSSALSNASRKVLSGPLKKNCDDSCKDAPAFQIPKVCSFCPGETPDREDWLGHLSALGGSVLTGTWEACQESFDVGP